MPQHDYVAIPFHYPHEICIHHHPQNMSATAAACLDIQPIHLLSYINMQLGAYRPQPPARAHANGNRRPCPCRHSCFPFLSPCKVSPFETDVAPMSLRLITVPPSFCIAAVKEQLVLVDGCVYVYVYTCACKSAWVVRSRVEFVNRKCQRTRARVIVSLFSLLSAYLRATLMSPLPIDG